MATYPPVSDAERGAALRRIWVWHERRGDPYWWRAETDGPEAAYRVLGYLRRRHVQLPEGWRRRMCGTN